MQANFTRSSKAASSWALRKPCSGGIPTTARASEKKRSFVPRLPRFKLGVGRGCFTKVYGRGADRSCAPALVYQQVAMITINISSDRQPYSEYSIGQSIQRPSWSLLKHAIARAFAPSPPPLQPRPRLSDEQVQQTQSLLY